MTGFFLVGIASFITVLIRRLGILLVLLSIALTLLSISGSSQSIFTWLIETNTKYTFTVLGMIGVFLQWLTYPMMKNAPLKMKSRKG